eukprot:CAMPEP_0172493346 /NCGR_PEP_ID=MMETSP1066-20121228/24754_1 /TAXON_ID=671091 /ORGANISM="Coscinodiscus wailesii, Strain CCMP2513" /LENGTH=647 /DNA_ID=CAMNT_0013263469 /DNA_START=48 /DNA_END=1991 /DNA_ORIENTATION=+
MKIGTVLTNSFLFGYASAAVTPVIANRHLRDLLLTTGASKNSCNADVPPIDFLLLKGDANAEAIEDEVREDLEAVGFTVNSRFLNKNDFNRDRAAGDFGLSFSETWGSPYDPHSYVSAWEAEDNANHRALVNMTVPASREELLRMIEDVLQEQDRNERRKKWKAIHEYYHRQAVMLPLWGRRIVAIINSRLTGYESGHQQFDFPVHRLVPVSGSDTVTISPGALTGRFETVGNLDPHTYNPNEFFSNNWVYEGLVSYGEGGQIVPSLAESWTVEDTPDGGSKYTFQLRANVLFHDGAPWNCQAAKLNLDHILAGALRTPVWHGWYGVPKYLKDWQCTDIDNDMELVMTTSVKYYPFLQELTFIRPLRFLSPNAFAEGPNSDPYTANSCERGWGTLESDDGTTVVCAGISNITGTGPFAYDSRVTSILTTGDFDETSVDDEVVFKRNDNYWGQPPGIATLKVVRYDSAQDIEAALLDGSLDVMWGDGVLPARAVTDIDDREDTNLQVFYGDDIQNVLLLLNTGRPPLDDINVRKTIVHAIQKNRFIDKELGGYLDAVDNVFPRDMPYCDVDLTPRWDYDIEKAILLSCASDDDSSVSAVNAAENSNTLALGLGLGIPCFLMFVVAAMYVKKSRDLEAKLVTSNSAVQA